MSFGNTNAPNILMRLMNCVFDSFIGGFIIVYFDDIPAYNKSLEEHLHHLKCVPSVIRI